ncbi:Photosynthetic NDH subunit of lumenal location 1, chloroplastic [Glycine soja]
MKAESKEYRKSDCAAVTISMAVEVELWVLWEGKGDRLIRQSSLYTHSSTPTLLCTLSAKLAAFKLFASQHCNFIYQHRLLCIGDNPRRRKSLPEKTTTVGHWSINCKFTTNKFGLCSRCRVFLDYEDGYSYIYPIDWKEFDFRALDSAFKDRYLQLQNVRVKSIPTEKKDIRDLGPMEEVIYNLVKHIYAAPNQRPTIKDMQEKTIDGKHYYTFEYILTSPNYSSASFATIAIGNGRYYTLIVGAIERRWKRFRDQLKVVADSFRLLDI